MKLLREYVNGFELPRLKEANIRDVVDERRSLGHFSSFGIACLSFSFLSLEVSFGSLRERERETVDNFPEITRNRKKRKTRNPKRKRGKVSG